MSFQSFFSFFFKHSCNIQIYLSRILDHSSIFLVLLETRCFTVDTIWYTFSLHVAFISHTISVFFLLFRWNRQCRLQTRDWKGLSGHPCSNPFFVLKHLLSCQFTLIMLFFSAYISSILLTRSSFVFFSDNPIIHTVKRYFEVYEQYTSFLLSDLILLLPLVEGFTHYPWTWIILQNVS